MEIEVPSAMPCGFNVTVDPLEPLRPELKLNDCVLPKVVVTV